MVLCEKQTEFSSWDSMSDYSDKNDSLKHGNVNVNSRIRRLSIPPDLEKKLNNLIGNKINSLNPTPNTSPNIFIPNPPPPPKLSLNTITNKPPKSEELYRDELIDDNLTSISQNLSTTSRNKTIVIKKIKRNKTINPLPCPSNVYKQCELNNDRKNDDVNKIMIEKSQVYNIMVGASFIMGYFFCFYFGKSC